MQVPRWLVELGPIVGFLVLLAVIVRRLPKIDIGHSEAFRRRRFLNWFPVGITYAFLYMARYNLSVLKDLVDERFISKEDFGTIFSIGTFTYGCSFILNGPLTDRLGGRKTILLSAIGTAAANAAIGVVVFAGLAAFQDGAGRPTYVIPALSVLYAINMYFQSFGAVSVVKINAAWFHLRERGTFGGIFGVLISLGLYFAFDWGRKIGDWVSRPAMFFIPAAILTLLVGWLYVHAKDTPKDAGLDDIETADAVHAERADGTALQRVWYVAKVMLSTRAILTIAAIEFCSGYLRNAIMQWYMSYAIGVGDFIPANKKTGAAAFGQFVPVHWGMMLCLAGIFGGMFAGQISDRIFQSRRGPVSAVLYGFMLLGSIAMFPLLGSPVIGYLVIFMSMCIIGVHGMLSGTASMDFGGKKNVGIAVGIIDGFVYLGTGLEALLLGKVLPAKAAAKVVSHWWTWPTVMVPAALLGLVLAASLWNAKPNRTAPAH